MTTWTDLWSELDRWHEAEHTATFWWRDDDAVSSTTALERLLTISARSAAGLALAVIPEGCAESLVTTLGQVSKSGGAEIAVLQHGIAHRNTAPAGEKKTELSAAVPLAVLSSGLIAGLHRLSDLFGDRALPVLVPPWNRIAPELVARLPSLGFLGLSTYKARHRPDPAPGLLQVNSHADLLRWKPERGFLGESETLALLLNHLQARRAALSGTDAAPGFDSREPTGILTHHLVHDEATWKFLELLLDGLNRHPAAQLLDPSEVFLPAGRHRKS